MLYSCSNSMHYDASENLITPCLLPYNDLIAFLLQLYGILCTLCDFIR